MNIGDVRAFQLRPRTTQYPSTEGSWTNMVQNDSLSAQTTKTSNSLTSDEVAVMAIGCVLGALLLAAAARLISSKRRDKRTKGTPNLGGSPIVSGRKSEQIHSHWPVEPRSLRNTVSRRIVIVLIDMLMVLAPLLFVILGGFAKDLDKKPVEEYPWGKQLITATQYGVTIYPILFAAVAGRVAEITAEWILERGGTILVLEQLFGSTTLFGTLKTQFLLRATNPLMFVLVVLWSLSPLGGQGTLRLISIEERSLTRDTSFWFLDTNAKTGEPTIFYAPKSIGMQGNTVNAVFSTSLTAPDDVQNATMDLWGNVKIPRFESLSVLPDSDGWKVVPQQNVSYSSLVGVPVANIPKIGNSSFMIQASFYEFSCPNDAVLLPGSEEIVWYGNGTGKVQGSGKTVVGQGTFTEYGHLNGAVFGTPLDVTFSIGTLPPSLIQSDSHKSGPLPVYIQSYVAHGNGDEIIAALSCTVTQPSVESKIHCHDGKCQSVAVRPATKYLVDPSRTFLDDVSNSGVLLQAFVAAGGPATNYPRYQSTFIEYYLAGNVTNANRVGLVDLTKVPGPDVAERLGRLFNSFWITSLAPMQITGGIASRDGSGDLSRSDMGGSLHNRTEGTVTIFQEIYECHNVWWAVLLISAGTLLVVALAAIILEHLTKGPAIVGHVSSLTRDNPNIPLPSAASTLDGFDRTKLLGETRVVLGDTRPYEAVGHIALLVMNDSEEDFRMLKKAEPNRVYN